VIGSLTVLPAMLSKLGDRIDRGRVPFLRRLATRDGDSYLWAAIVGGVLRRPLLWGALATALLIALAIPALRGGRGWDRVGAARPREAPSQVPGRPFAAPAPQTSLREGTADSPRARSRCARGSVRG
jgi:hypothetical protein